MNERANAFLRMCLRGRWDESVLETARVMSQEESFDWDTVCDVARRGGVAPLLYIIGRGHDLFSPAIEEELHADYLRNARRNLLLFHELADILRQLETRGIPTIVLKGAALAEAVYGNLAVRSMGDVDVLVPPEDVPSALRILIDMGYEAPYVEIRPGFRIAYNNEVRLHKPGAHDRAVEIHWDLLTSPHHRHAMALDWFWETATPLQVADVTTRMLAPEAQLLHLCGHLLVQHAHETPRLSRLHDIAEVLIAYRQTLDWEVLLRQAQAFDLTLPVRQLLLQVTEEWGVPIPEAALPRLRALEPSTQEARVSTELNTSHRPIARRYWTSLLFMPGWRTRLRYLGSIFFPSAVYMQIRYAIRHSWLTPLYYPYRFWMALRWVLRRL